MIELAKTILFVKAQIQSASFASNQRVQYAVIKSVETIAKSLLSKQLPMKTQEELATMIATALSLPDRDQLLV